MRFTFLLGLVVGLLFGVFPAHADIASPAPTAAAGIAGDAGKIANVLLALGLPNLGHRQQNPYVSPAQLKADCPSDKRFCCLYANHSPPEAVCEQSTEACTNKGGRTLPLDE